MNARARIRPTISAVLSRRYPIDPQRIYAAGMSNGATFTQYLGRRLANTIAAIAPVAGSMPAAGAPGCRPQRAISVLEIGGTADPIMPFGGGEVRTAAFWARNNGCARVPVTAALPPIAPNDGTSARRPAVSSALHRRACQPAVERKPHHRRVLPRAPHEATLKSRSRTPWFTYLSFRRNSGSISR